MAERGKEEEEQGYIVRLDDVDAVSASDPAALLAADHLRAMRGFKGPGMEEDPAIRAQLEHAERYRTDTLKEGEGMPLILMPDPGPETWDIKELQRVVQAAYTKFAEYDAGTPATGWNLAEHKHRRKDWRLLEHLGKDGVFRIKVEAQLNVPAYRIVRVNRDLDFGTRCQWDGDDLKPVHLKAPDGSPPVVLPAIRRRCVKIIRPYRKRALQRAMLKSGQAPMDRCFEIIESFVHPPEMVRGLAVPGVSIRRFFAVQWGSYDAEKREYVLLTPSIESVPKDESIFGCPSGCVDATGFAGMRLNVDAGDPNKTNVTMVAAINPNGWIPENLIAWYKERLLDRAELIERTCTDPKYTSIYGGIKK